MDCCVGKTLFIAILNPVKSEHEDGLMPGGPYSEPD